MGWEEDPGEGNMEGTGLLKKLCGTGICLSPFCELGRAGKMVVVGDFQARLESQGHLLLGPLVDYGACSASFQSGISMDLLSDVGSTQVCRNGHRAGVCSFISQRDATCTKS